MLLAGLKKELGWTKSSLTPTTKGGKKKKGCQEERGSNGELKQKKIHRVKFLSPSGERGI